MVEGSSLRSACVARSCAAAPATCGVAIDVPDLSSTALSEEETAAAMSEPGAKTSTHRPEHIGARSGRDRGEIGARLGRDLGETRARSGRDRGEVGPGIGGCPTVV